MRASVLLALVTACAAKSPPAQPVTIEQLGESLFSDTTLSEPPGQSCADCHDPSAAFADPEEDRTSAGAIRERSGTRNTPTAMYARFIPPLHAVGDEMFGGLFWDGRAASLEAQAAFPLLNPLEMNNPDKATVVRKVRQKHGRAMTVVFGARAFDDVDRAYAHVTEAIAAFERTSAFSPFSSRYDAYLAGTADLDEREHAGLRVFAANCARCHPHQPGPDGSPPLFTTFGYANLDVPPFRDNPFYRLPPSLNPDGEHFVDRGLGATTGNPKHDGMFRIPTLRNVARTTPYTHDGYFRRLDEMIAFIDERDPAIQLTRQDIIDLVAFLATLTDGHP